MWPSYKQSKQIELVAVVKVASFDTSKLFEPLRPFEIRHLSEGLLIDGFNAFDNVGMLLAYIMLLSGVGFEVEQH